MKSEFAKSGAAVVSAVALILMAFGVLTMDITTEPANEPAARGVSNFDSIETSGDLTVGGSFSLNTPVWDDLRVPSSSTRINPAQTKPDTGAFRNGTLVFLFDPASEESVHFAAQMPHAWAEGTAVRPHVHWSPTSTNTGVVQWGLECTIATPGGDFPATTTITTTEAANGTAYHHEITGFDEIDMTGNLLSTMLICRLYRDADAAADTYTGDVAFTEIDFHYQTNSLGSTQEYVK